MRPWGPTQPLGLPSVGNNVLWSQGKASSSDLVHGCGVQTNGQLLNAVVHPPKCCGPPPKTAVAHPPKQLCPPLCDILSGCCFFPGAWTVTRSSLRMLRRVAAFCRLLRPVLHVCAAPSLVSLGCAGCGGCRLCVSGAQYLAYRGCAGCCAPPPPQLLWSTAGQPSTTAPTHQPLGSIPNRWSTADTITPNTDIYLHKRAEQSSKFGWARQ